MTPLRTIWLLLQNEIGLIGVCGVGDATCSRQAKQDQRNKRINSKYRAEFLNALPSFFFMNGVMAFATFVSRHKFYWEGALGAVLVFRYLLSVIIISRGV